MEKTMIANLEKNTGRSLNDWIKIVNDAGFGKHGEMVRFLKTEHGMTHGFANLVAHKARGSDAGSSTETDLIDGQYKGKEHFRPLYENLVKEIKGFGEDVEIAPKKAYVSLRRKKQFGLIQPSTKKRVDIGINLKGREATKNLEASGSWNAMVSHRVRISEGDEVGSDVIQWLRDAYEQAG